MPSLSEVYRGKQSGASLRRLLFGLGLFLAGALLVVTGIVIATTDVLYGTDPAALTAKRQLGGVLAGVGVPAVFLGIFAVLPSGRLTKAAAVVGAGIAVVGVALFTHAYPCRWSGSLCGAGKPDLTLMTVGVYFLGAIVTFWCLFVGVANFKTRNDPGGTATVNVTRKSETRYVPVERSRGGLGGIGFFGGTPDGEVETQTGGRGGSGSSGSAGTASDGGTEAESISSPLDESTTQPQSQSPDGRQKSDSRDLDASDTYCGNCAHFEYVRTEEGIQPYCGAHEELMDDMDACEEWTSRPTRRR
ncbi:MAG: ribonuclease BN [Halobellus sp.]